MYYVDIKYINYQIKNLKDDYRIKEKEEVVKVLEKVEKIIKKNIKVDKH